MIHSIQKTMEDLNDEEWTKSIEAQLSEMRRELAMKLDKSSIEVVHHQQEEKLRRMKKNIDKRNYYETTNENTDPEIHALQAIKVGDLETAYFLTLRFIETTSNMKSNKDEIAQKTTLEYANSLFNRLSVVNNEQIRESTNNLKASIEELFSGIYKEFDEVKTQVEENVQKMETRVQNLQNQVRLYGLIMSPSKPKTDDLQVFGEQKSKPPLTNRKTSYHRQFMKSQQVNRKLSNNHPDPDLDFVLTSCKYRIPKNE